MVRYIRLQCHQRKYLLRISNNPRRKCIETANSAVKGSYVPARLSPAYASGGPGGGRCRTPALTYQTKGYLFRTRRWPRFSWRRRWSPSKARECRCRRAIRQDGRWIASLSATAPLRTSVLYGYVNLTWTPVDTSPVQEPSGIRASPEHVGLSLGSSRHCAP